MNNVCFASSAMWLLAPSLVIGGLLLALWSWSRRRSARYFALSKRISREAINSPVEADIPDRRQVLRRWGPPVAVLLAEAKNGAPDPVVVSAAGNGAETLASVGDPVEAWVINRSSDGLCLSAPKAVSAGSVLLVRVAVGTKDMPWIKLEVKHSLPVDLRWRLGCKFAEKPPADVIGLFG